MTSTSYQDLGFYDAKFLVLFEIRRTHVRTERFFDDETVQYEISMHTMLNVGNRLFCDTAIPYPWPIIEKPHPSSLYIFLRGV